MKKFIILIVVTFSLQVYGNEEPISENWISADVTFISKLKVTFKNNPLSVLALLESDQHRKSALGYGYSYAEGSMGKGYVSVSFSILYKDEEPISYKLTPYMPDDDRLKDRYTKLFEGLFTVSKHELQPLYFNKEEAVSPLESCTTNISVIEKIESYMSPYSGIRYGSRGGYANSLLQNRREYVSLKDQLNDKVHEHLLCSKNPATRLTAIEYFTSKNRVNSPKISAKIDEIFNETPTIETFAGCMIMDVDSRELVKELSTQKIEQ